MTRSAAVAEQAIISSVNARRTLLAGFTTVRDVGSQNQARFAVRSNFKYGADVIKTCATGVVLSPINDVDVPQLSQAELNALVDEAHALRRKTNPRARS